jgi:hypothetical protein
MAWPKFEGPANYRDTTQTPLELALHGRDSGVSWRNVSSESAAIAQLIQ